MVFASPLWLLALLPWGGLTLWLLWGRRQRTIVPFLQLWRGPELVTPPKAGLRRPPIFIVFAVFAGFAALLAAAGPQARPGAGGRGRLTLIIDRGWTMSGEAEGKTRYRQAAADAMAALADAGYFDQTPAQVVVIGSDGPATAEVTLRDLDAWISRSVAPSGRSTADQLAAAVRLALAEKKGAIVVLSDQPLPVEDARIVRFSPGRRGAGAAILSVSARQSPFPAVMVRVRNDGAPKEVTVVLRSGGWRAEQRVSLPPAGEARNFIFSAPALGETITAAIKGFENAGPTTQFYLAKDSGNRRVEARTPLQPGLQRLLDIYARQRPPSADAMAVTIAASPGDLPAGAAGIIVPPMVDQVAAGPIDVTGHPITRDVGWQSLGPASRVAPAPPSGWTVLLSRGGRPLLAANGDPAARQAWVGFDMTADFMASTDFVVFWANLLSWVGQGGESFAWHPLDEWDPQWHRVADSTLARADGQWPGIYENDQKRLRAFDTQVDDRSVPTTTPGAAAVLAALKEAGPGAKSLAAVAIILAVAGLGLAALTWRRSTLTALWASRSFSAVT